MLYILLWGCPKWDKSGRQYCSHMQKMILSLLEMDLLLSPESHVGSLERLASRLLSKKFPPQYLSGS